MQYIFNKTKFACKIQCRNYQQQVQKTNLFYRSGKLTWYIQSEAGFHWTRWRWLIWWLSRQSQIDDPDRVVIDQWSPWLFICLRLRSFHSAQLIFGYETTCSLRMTSVKSTFKLINSTSIIRQSLQLLKAYAEWHETTRHRRDTQCSLPGSAPAASGKTGKKTLQGGVKHQAWRKRIHAKAYKGQTHPK